MSIPTYETLEQAQEAILDLCDQITTLTTERDTLSQNNDQLKSELETVRTINQKYYLKLRAQAQDQEDKTDDDEKEVPSCEDFARTHNIL